MIVKAKAKNKADIPADYKCCSLAVAGINETEIVFIETTTIHVTIDTCAFCGTVRKASASAQIVGEPEGNEIILECFDLDEGETSPGDFLNG